MLALAIGGAALLGLTGCAPEPSVPAEPSAAEPERTTEPDASGGQTAGPTAEPTAAPSGAPSGAPSAGPTAGPSASASPRPSRSPAERPPPEPSRSAESTPPAPSATAASAPDPGPDPLPPAPPSPTATADAVPYCGDEFVLDRNHLMWWPGDAAAQLAAADVRDAFEPADAIAGLDVVCAASYSSPVDGAGGGIVRVSEALLERAPRSFAALRRWARTNGYTTTAEQPFVERSRPEAADGTTTMKIFWAPLDGDDPTIGGADDIARQTGAASDAIYVWHADFTGG